MSDPQKAAELQPLNIDETQMTQQDLEFEAFVHRRALMNIAGGALVGFGVPYALTRRAAAAGRGGGLTRGAMIAACSFGGMLAGAAVTSWQVTSRLDQLDNSSYIKKLANQVLVGRYPMAVADAMEERKKRQQGQNK